MNPSPTTSTVQDMLLQESRAEISRLRTENFQCKRLAEGRLSALHSVSAERDQLLYQVNQLQGLLSASHAQVQELQGVQAQLLELQQAQHKLQQEHELSLRARRILQEELADERRQRKQVEEAKAVLESERSRHQRAKDDLAMSLRVARKKAEEAEEEQLRAEQEASQLRNELRALQSGAGVARQTEDDVGAAQQEQAHRNPLPGSQEVAVEEALRAAEYERCRAETLLGRLTAAEEEVASLGLEVQALEEMRAELYSVRHALHDLQAQQNSQQSGPKAAQQQLEQQQLEQQQPLPPPQQQQPQSNHGESDLLPVPPSAMEAGIAPAQQPRLTPEVLAEIDALRSKVAKLKASRDKLLEQIDKQWEELDRLGVESKAAQDELASTRRLAANWEAQAQDSLAHVDRLKEMLEEASAWDSGSAKPTEPADGSGPGATDGQQPPAEGSGTDSHESTEAAILRERARSTEMELMARACAAELLRAQHASMSMGKAMLPALSGIEYRLNSLLRSQAFVSQLELNAPHR